MNIVIEKDISNVDLDNYFSTADFRYDFYVIDDWDEYIEGSDRSAIVKTLVGDVIYDLWLIVPYQDNLVLHEVGFRISKEFLCKAWVSDPLYELDSSPFWSTLYNCGDAFIVDDVALEENFRFEDLIVSERVIKGKVKSELQDFSEKNL